MDLALHATYNPLLVLLSVLVGIGASYTAIELLHKSTLGASRRFRLGAGAVLMGLGIWSMQVIGLLAFRLDMPVSFDAPMILGALVLAVIASGLAFAVATRPAGGRGGVLMGGVSMGLAILGVQHLATGAMRLPALVTHHPVLLGLSVAIALAASASAMWLAVWLRAERLPAWSWRKVGSAVTMGAGIAGAHYTGMAALVVLPSDVQLAPTTMSLSVTELDAVVIGFCSVFVLAAGLSSAFKEHLQSRQSALEATRRHLAAIVESSHDAILAMTPEGVITSWNPAAERLFGYTAAEAVGMDFASLVAPSHRCDAIALLETAHRGTPVANREVVGRHRDDRPVDVALSLAPMPDEQSAIGGVSVIARDVGDRKRAEAQAARWAARLEEANAQLRQADRHKDEFLSVISHELRTPLNFITGFASILEDEVPGPLNGAQADCVGKILNGADRMLHLVNDLLDVAKLQAGKFDLAPEPTPYWPLVEEVLASLRPLADERGLRLEALVADEVAPVVDGTRLVQVLTNLVSNAVKFTPAGGTVTLRAFVRGTDLVTQVTDTGCGIAPDQITRLFQRFGQLDMSATRQVGGTGLGLSICKALVEAHGGQIGVLSEPDVGSTFWFVLPLDGPPATGPLTGSSLEEPV